MRADGLQRAVLDEPRELDQEKELVVLTLQVCVRACVHVWRIGKSNVSCWYALYWTCQCRSVQYFAPYYSFTHHCRVHVYISLTRLCMQDHVREWIALIKSLTSELELLRGDLQMHVVPHEQQREAIVFVPV